MLTQMAILDDYNDDVDGSSPVWPADMCRSNKAPPEKFLHHDNQEIFNLCKHVQNYQLSPYFKTNAND